MIILKGYNVNCRFFFTRIFALTRFIRVIRLYMSIMTSIMLYIICNFIFHLRRLIITNIESFKTIQRKLQVLLTRKFVLTRIYTGFSSLCVDNDDNNALYHLKLYIPIDTTYDNKHTKF